MACSTCAHTMHGIGYGMFWCPRCGSLLHEAMSIPALVLRCRDFEGKFPPTDLASAKDWHRLGIRESINLPENRPPAPTE